MNTIQHVPTDPTAEDAPGLRSPPASEVTHDSTDTQTDDDEVQVVFTELETKTTTSRTTWTKMYVRLSNQLMRTKTRAIRSTYLEIHAIICTTRVKT